VDGDGRQVQLAISGAVSHDRASHTLIASTDVHYRALVTADDKPTHAAILIGEKINGYVLTTVLNNNQRTSNSLINYQNDGNLLN